MNRATRIGLATGVAVLLAWAVLSILQRNATDDDPVGAQSNSVKSEQTPHEPEHPTPEASPSADQSAAPTGTRTQPSSLSDTSFQVSARATPWPPLWSPAEVATTQLLHHDGFDWIAGETAPVGTDGSTPPFKADFPAGTPLRVLLSGGTLARTFVDLEAGEPGASAQVELPVEEGSALLLSALDPDDGLIYDARFHLVWGVGQQRLGVDLTADASGVAKLTGAPSGRLVPYVSAPGWATGKGRALRVPRDANRVHNIVLFPAGRIEGRCIRDGQPVKDFTISTWQLLELTTCVERVFRGREDGSFVIDDIPLGWSRIVATLPGGERSDPEVVWIPYDEEEEVESVELDIAPGLRGGGVVVAGASGSPVEGALVRAWISDTVMPIAPTALVTRTDAAGSFDFPPPIYPNTMVSVESEGYAKAWGSPSTLPDGSVGFGQIALHAPVSAQLILESSGPLPLQTYYASVRGTDIEELHPIPPSGRIELGDLEVGYCRVDIFETPILLMTIGRLLGPDQVWKIRVPAVDSRALEFQVLGQSVEAERQARSIHLEGRSPEGDDYTMWRYFDAGRSARIAPVPDGEFTLRIDDRGGNTLYQSSFVVGPDDGDILLSAELTSTLTFVHVVDEEGRPVDQATIAILPKGADSPDLAATDADGRVSFSGLPPGPVEITIWDAEGGTESGIPAEVLADEDTHLELVLPSQRSLLLLAKVGESPVQGLAFLLRTEPGDFQVASHSTDENGLVEFPRCGSGRYYVVTPGNDTIWPQWQYVEIGDGEPNTIALHHRGTLHLEFLDEAEAPLANTDFFIFHEVLEYVLVDTVGDGSWESSTSALRTDAAGQVQLSKIPEGRYRVFLPGGTKSWKMGVSPGETTFETLRPHPQ